MYISSYNIDIQAIALNLINNYYEYCCQQWKCQLDKFFWKRLDVDVSEADLLYCKLHNYYTDLFSWHVRTFV